MRYANRLVDASIAPSVGSVGDAYDNALAESVIRAGYTSYLRHARCHVHRGRVVAGQLIALVQLRVVFYNHRRRRP